jgi:bacterial/archaeal transporter family protein
MNHRLITVLIISILWALSNILCKKITKNNNILCLVLIKLIIMGFMGYIIFIYNTKIKDEVFNLNKKTILILFLIGLIEVIALYLYFISLENNDVSWTVPMIEGTVILLSMVISYYFLNEKITFIKILGFFTILMGIYIVNLS